MICLGGWRGACSPPYEGGADAEGAGEVVLGPKTTPPPSAPPLRKGRQWVRRNIQAHL